MISIVAVSKILLYNNAWKIWLSCFVVNILVPVTLSELRSMSYQEFLGVITQQNSASLQWSLMTGISVRFFLEIYSTLTGDQQDCLFLTWVLVNICKIFANHFLQKSYGNVHTWVSVVDSCTSSWQVIGITLNARVLSTYFAFAIYLVVGFRTCHSNGERCC